MAEKSNNEKFLEKALIVHKDKGYIYPDQYVRGHSKIRIICPVHGEFWQIASNHLFGKGCSKCAWKVRDPKLPPKSRKKYKKLKVKRIIIDKNLVFINKAKLLSLHMHKNYDYTKFIYVNAHTKGIIICPKHGEFTQAPTNHLMGRGCPHCRASKGEITIRNFLIENNINFNQQYRFNNCRDIKPLPFDFYLPDLNLCIEFHGKQHYEGWYQYKENNKSSLQSIRYRDNIKRNYCLQNNIKYIEIKYDENIEQKLLEINKKCVST